MFHLSSWNGDALLCFYQNKLFKGIGYRLLFKWRRTETTSRVPLSRKSIEIANLYKTDKRLSAIPSVSKTIIIGKKSKHFLDKINK